MVRTLETPRHTETSVETDEEILTLKKAAEFLNVDRRYLITLLDAGEIPFTGRGPRRQVRRANLLAYKAARDTKRHAALDELTRLSEEAGLYEADYSSIVSDPS